MAARTLDAALKRQPDSPETEALKDRNLRKMGDLSSMMKLLLQRFGVWFNRRHRRAGTVWGDRFKSLIVEPTRDAMEKVAAYIDLNPVRAGLVKDPKDYRWCGYGEALMLTLRPPSLLRQPIFPPPPKPAPRLRVSA